MSNSMIAAFILAMVTLTNCGESSESLKIPRASFNISEISGKVVTFENTSVGDEVTYSWDFGDSETSSETSPVHTYESNGTYVVTLTATNSAGSSPANSVVEIINIKIDGNLSDWEDVPSLVDCSNCGFLTKLKVENLENNKLFVYVQANQDMKPLNPEEGTVIQIVLDVDNDPTTGADVCWYWNQAGEDFMFEGSFLGAEGTFTFIEDSGNEGCGWNWNNSTTAVKDDYMVASELQTITGGYAYELSIDLAALPSTVGGGSVSSEKIRIGVHHNYQWGMNSLIPQQYNENDCPECSLASYNLK